MFCLTCYKEYTIYSVKDCRVWSGQAIEGWGRQERNPTRDKYRN